MKVMQIQFDIRRDEKEQVKVAAHVCQGADNKKIKQKKDNRCSNW